jgi:hypothetical protein
MFLQSHDGDGSMSKNWIAEYLDDAVARNLCTRIGCTTCGAREFRRGAWSAMARDMESTDGSDATGSIIIEMARALARVTPPDPVGIRLVEAARCLIYDLWSNVPVLDRELEQVLAGSWAGEVLLSMQRHHAAREASYRRADAMAAARVVREEEKRKKRQEQHALRLERKRERDRLLMGGTREPGGAS